MTLLNNADNSRKSSRKVLGTIYLIASLLIAIAGWYIDRYMSFDVWLSIVIVGGSLIGITTMDYFAKK